MSRFTGSPGWRPLHHAQRTGHLAQVHLHDGGYIVAPVIAIGTEEDQVELGNAGAHFWIPWSSIKSAIVVSPPPEAA